MLENSQVPAQEEEKGVLEGEMPESSTDLEHIKPTGNISNIADAQKHPVHDVIHEETRADHVADANTTIKSTKEETEEVKQPANGKSDLLSPRLPKLLQQCRCQTENLQF